MKEFKMFGKSFSELVPSFIKIGFALGIIAGIILLVKF